MRKCNCEHWQSCDECRPAHWGTGRAALRQDEQQRKNEEMRLAMDSLIHGVIILKDGKRIDPREMYPKFRIGDTVKKTKGSQWHGKIVGTYSTTLTPEGYAVESSTEIGSVQIYPAAALEKA
jgi:dihydrofolate reductase (trimethoprim resistance protein)